MALLSGDVRFASLEMDVGLKVYLPYDRPGESPFSTPCKVVYLLHGIKGNSASWVEWSMAQTHAKNTGVALVIPEVQRSFYTDMQYGPRYFTMVAEELPALCQRMFGISPRREDTFIAGLSMGGYGAFKAALRHPERFAGVGVFSPVTDPAEFAFTLSGSALTAREWQAIWGEQSTPPPEDDLFYLASEAAKLPKAAQPRIYHCCGTEDYLYRQSLRLKTHVETLGLDYQYEEWPGAHDWAFWDAALPKMLDVIVK